jgi:hypothetical protein
MKLPILVSLLLASSAMVLLVPAASAGCPDPDNPCDPIPWDPISPVPGPSFCSEFLPAPNDCGLEYVCVQETAHVNKCVHDPCWNTATCGVNVRGLPVLP